MEDIYTIKVKSNPDPRSLYPSERRYSASTVLGLGVVHFALANTVLLLAILSLSSQEPKKEIFPDGTTQVEDRQTDMAFLDDQMEEKISTNGLEEEFNKYINLSLFPCIMVLGGISAGLTAFLAWKKWYIDYFIKWFFFMSNISLVTSLICLVMTSLTVTQILDQHNQKTNTFIFSFNEDNLIVDRLQTDSLQAKLFSKSANKPPNLKLVLSINILIASFLEVMWSILSVKISYFGMRNSYPDDMVVNRGKIEVNTVHKGNKKPKVVAPDILNHHPKKKKFVRYFPKAENNNLPKQETSIEYKDRFDKFLSSNVPPNE